MKYSELEKLLRKSGCELMRGQMNSHPLWRSEVTGQMFKTSNHRSEEVPKGTLMSIKKAAGIK